MDKGTLEKLMAKGIYPASRSPERAYDKLFSGIGPVDHVLAGGLDFGEIVEFGMPYGTGGRQIVLQFLKNATRGFGLRGPLLCLWVSSSNCQAAVYPPYWHAHGIDLRRMHFVSSDMPIEQLKHFFLDSLFRFIIFDDPKKLSRSDMAYLARRAHENSQIILILRNFYLTNRLGNVWSKLRVNCWQSSGYPYPFRIETLRGGVLASRSFVLRSREP